MKPIVICFAGSTAAGKTEMAYYLSEQFGLPIFSSDTVRNDTKVAKDVVDIHDALGEFEASRKARAQAMFARKKSFIYDGSVDRRWEEVKKQVEDAGFGWLLIDFDVSLQRIMKNKQMFDRIELDELFNKWVADHQKFHQTFDADAQLHISDDNYAQRYELAKELVNKALNS